MSFQAMSWAIGLKLPSRDKFVLLMLANYASNDAGDCYPSLGRLCEDTSMSRHTVIDAIKALAEAGALQVIRRTQDGVSLPNVYRLNLAFRGSADAALGGSAADAPPVHELHGGSAATALKPINEPKKKKEERRVREVVAESGRIALEVDGELLASWASAFPALNVPMEVARAELWLNANPANRKSNYERFLLNWLTRAQDNAPRVAAQAQPRPASTSRRPVHESWLTPNHREAGNVIDVVATPVSG